MAVEIIKPKDRKEWLHHRQFGIGSSEVASILGLNPYQTPYQLWRRKLGIDSGPEETFAMRAGHYLEDAVTMFWQDETGREVIKSSAGDWLYVNTEKEFLRASPDRTFWLPGMAKNNKNKGVLECKTTQMAVDPDDLPKHWFCQLQYLLGVSEMEHGSLAWLSAGRNFGYKHMEFVPDFFDWMRDEVERFWRVNIQERIEPEVINVADVMIKFSKHTEGKVNEVAPELYERWKELKGIKEELAKLEERKDNLEEAIKMAFEDAEALTYQGTTLATWKAAKEGKKFDAKALEKAEPEIYSKYLAVVPGSRRFLLK